MVYCVCKFLKSKHEGTKFWTEFLLLHNTLYCVVSLMAAVVIIILPMPPFVVAGWRLVGPACCTVMYCCKEVHLSVIQITISCLYALCIGKCEKIWWKWNKFSDYFLSSHTYIFQNIKELKIEVLGSSETSVSIYWTWQRYINLCSLRHV
jgi:hypothetical protein